MERLNWPQSLYMKIEKENIWVWKNFRVFPPYFLVDSGVLIYIYIYIYMYIYLYIYIVVIVLWTTYFNGFSSITVFYLPFRLYWWFVYECGWKKLYKWAV